MNIILVNMLSKLARVSAISILIVQASILTTYAQVDTVYISFEESDMSVVERWSSSKIKPDSLPYPMDWSRFFVYSKKVGQHIKKLTFSFRNHTLEGSGIIIDFKSVSTDIIAQNDFKTIDWFKDNSFSDIIKYFEPTGKERPVIYLVDKKSILNGSMMLIRVYFRYTISE